jgi:Ca2+-binding EF-hand superfamily protein
MLSEIRRKKLTHLFHLRDANDDGLLEKADYENTAKRLAEIFKWGLDSDGYHLMLNAQLFEWEELQKFADANHDSQVTLDEFLVAYDAMPIESIQQNVDDMINFAFGWFDKDRDGKLQKDEHALLLSVFNVSTADANGAFAILDSNKDGKLSEKDLRKEMRDFFLSDDVNAVGNHFWGKIE